MIFLGWIRDYTGSYSLCLHAQNVLLLIVIIIWLPEILYRKYKKTKKRTQRPVAIWWNDNHLTLDDAMYSLEFYKTKVWNRKTTKNEKKLHTFYYLNYIFIVQSTYSICMHLISHINKKNLNTLIWRGRNGMKMPLTFYNWLIFVKKYKNQYASMIVPSFFNEKKISLIEIVGKKIIFQMSSANPNNNNNEKQFYLK